MIQNKLEKNKVEQNVIHGEPMWILKDGQRDEQERQQTSGIAGCRIIIFYILKGQFTKLWKRDCCQLPLLVRSNTAIFYLMCRFTRFYLLLRSLKPLSNDKTLIKYFYMISRT